MFIVSHVWSCNSKASSDQASKDKDRECMPWSLKGHSVIANAWRKNWARQLCMQNLKINYVEHQPFLHKFLWRTSSLICDSSMVWKKWCFKNSNYLWWFFNLTFTPCWSTKSPNKVNPRHSHLAFLCFRPEPMIALNFSVSNINLDRFSCRAPKVENQKSSQLDAFNGKWHSFFLCTRVLPAYPMRIAKDFMPCIWRCSWKTLTWSEVLPSNSTTSGFNFWRFGFFAETFATAQRFAKSGHKLCVCLCLNSLWTGKGGIEKKIMKMASQP